jgi:hypothetical protein
LWVRTIQAGNLLASVELIFDSKSYTAFAGHTARRAKDELVASICRQGWVEELVISLEKLIAAGVSV